MFRISQLMRELVEPTPAGPRRPPPGPVVIWNLVRRCNLACRHCYSISGNVDFPGELTTEEVCRTLADLKAYRVPALILSGGEPLMRSDILDISRRGKELGLYLALSTNGTLIDDAWADRIAGIGYDYVGISLDGLRATHDVFRRKAGAFDASIAAVRRCRDRGIKVGLRFTLTRDNAADLPALLNLAEAEGIDKFYLSHLNYSGRGNKNRGDDAHFDMTRRAMDLLFERAHAALRAGRHAEFVTGNNDADGVYLLSWVAQRYPDKAAHIRAKLVQWGGNASGESVANIDNLGNVHPDTYWPHATLGNVRERAFSEIWSDLSNPLIAGLRRRPRAVGGRCGTCSHLDICNGNTRTRAFQLTGDPWAEDPGCYLADHEIGAQDAGPRIPLTPFKGVPHVPLHA